ncbi:energy transducer TonB [Frateuria aurantia]
MRQRGIHFWLAMMLGLVLAGGASAGTLSGAAWPRDALGHPASGHVLMQARIGTHGELIGLRLLRSSGYTAFDKAAASELANYPFKPRMLHGRAIVADMLVPVSFQPQAGSAPASQVRIMPVNMYSH